MEKIKELEEKLENKVDSTEYQLTIIKKMDKEAVMKMIDEMMKLIQSGNRGNDMLYKLQADVQLLKDKFDDLAL